MMHSFKTVSCALLDVMTSSLVPVKPWDDSLSVLPTVEVEEFCQTCPDAAHPHTTYVNNLYVYPLSLNYSNQKVFSKVMKKLKFPVKVSYEKKPFSNNIPLRRLMSEHFYTILFLLQARNISVKIEFRDSDDENAKPLKVSVMFSVKFHL